MSKLNKTFDCSCPAHLAVPQEDPMLSLIKTHAAWRGDASALQAEKLLKGYRPLTYLLRQGDSKYQFFLTYLKEDQMVKHVPFKIELTIRKWSYRNGTGIVSDDLNDFVPLVMHCKRSQCHALN